MDERYTISLIDSTKSYLYNLQYLAKDNAQTLKDISILDIFTNLYNWADWFEVSENDKIKLQKLMDCILFRNSDLTLPTIVPGTYYSNVSTPQTIHTWQRVYDNFDVITHITDPTVVEIIRTIETIGLEDDLGFEFRDITPETAQIYDLDLKATYPYIIESVTLETDNGTIDSIMIQINGISVQGLENLTAGILIVETPTTGLRNVNEGDKVTLVTSGSSTGIPTLLKGKLNIRRI